MHSVRNTLTRLTLAVAFLATAAVTVAAEEPGRLTARIETQGRYYRVGEPIKVRVVLENLTDAPIANPEGLPISSNLELRQGDQSGKRASSPPAFDPATQPKVFAPGAGHLLVVDLATLFEDLHTPGYYSLSLRSERLDSEPIESCTLITVPASPGLTSIHDRMPAILRPEDEEAWLAPEETPRETLEALLTPYDDNALALTPVSTRVNSVKNDDKTLIQHHEEPSLGF